MLRNRIDRFYSDWSNDEQKAAPVAPAGFVAVHKTHLPVNAQHSLEQNQQLYQIAFAQAMADCRRGEPD
jgi:hypothetical protein